MKFIKEVLKFNLDKETNSVSPYEHRIVVRTNSYGSNFKFFQLLYDEVKRDFPHITPEIADIKHYAGRRYKHTYGIEFNIKSEIKVPDGYTEISEVEYTL